MTEHNMLISEGYNLIGNPYPELHDGGYKR